MRALLCIASALALAGIPYGTAAVAQEPAFEPGSGQTVLIDLGHNTLGERILSPVERLRDDGYVVGTFTEPITETLLAGADIVVIVNALADRNALSSLGPTPAACGSAGVSAECMDSMNARLAVVWRRPVPPAYSVGEVDALEDWIRGGGGLFLVFDIFPMAGAIESLVGRFGVEVSNGFAVDERQLPDSPDDIGAAGEFSFRRVERTLADHPVTNGRDPAERVDVVASIFGSAFRLPPRGRSLFTFGPWAVSLLPEVAWEFSAETPRQSIAGWSQGGLLRVGEGRLAIFAESGILQPHRPGFDERHPDARNSELVMNAFHWLSGLLDERE